MQADLGQCCLHLTRRLFFTRRCPNRRIFTYKPMHKVDVFWSQDPDSVQFKETTSSFLSYPVSHVKLLQGSPILPTQSCGSRTCEMFVEQNVSAIKNSVCKSLDFIKGKWVVDVCYSNYCSFKVWILGTVYTFKEDNSQNCFPALCKKVYSKRK